jgi:hypothetical protein
VRFLLLLLVLFTGEARAADVKLRWTWPAFNGGDSCAVDSTKALLDLYRGELFVKQIPNEHEMSLGFLPGAGMAGRNDSCVVALADSIHYAVFWMNVDDGTNVSCLGNQELVAIKARDWQPGIMGSYFNNEDLTSLFAKRDDIAIAFTWGQGAPLSGMGVDTFSEHWEGQINFPVPGVWGLTGLVEDGWRAWVGGVYVANDFGVQNVHSSSCHFNIAAAGWTPIIVEAMHHNGNAEMTLSWEPPPGGVTTAIPVSNWRH